MADRPRLYTSGEVAAELRMSERAFRDWLLDLGYPPGTRGVRRMFTPDHLDMLTD